MQPRVIKRATAVPMLPQLVGIGRTADTVATIAPVLILSTLSSSTTVPYGARKVRLMAVGGGGGPRNGTNLASGGASGGSNASGVYDVTPDLWGTTISWTIGAAGAPGAAGGTTTISWPAAKLTLTAPGGVAPTTNAGAVGVPASGGQVNNTGKTGSAGNSGSGNDGGGGGAAGGLEFAAGGNGANGNTASANVWAAGGGGVGAYGGWVNWPGLTPTIQPGNPPDAGIRGPGNQGMCFSQNTWVNVSADGGWGGGGAGSYAGGNPSSGHGGVYVQLS